MITRVAPSLSYNKSVTRGNKFKLQNQSFNHNFRKFFFSARIVNIWNSLPNYVVDVQSIEGVGKMRNCGMRNAESKMRNGPCGKVPRNGV